jgi:hypothetical protein
LFSFLLVWILSGCFFGQDFRIFQDWQDLALCAPWLGLQFSGSGWRLGRRPRVPGGERGALAEAFGGTPSGARGPRAIPGRFIGAQYAPE